MMERINYEKVKKNFTWHGEWYDWFIWDVFYWERGNGDSLTGEDFVEKKFVDNLSLLSYGEEIASESQKWMI